LLEAESFTNQEDKKVVAKTWTRINEHKDPTEQILDSMEMDLSSGIEITFDDGFFIGGCGDSGRKNWMKAIGGPGLISTVRAPCLFRICCWAQLKLTYPTHPPNNSTALQRHRIKQQM